MATATTRVVDGMRTRVRVIGDGPPLLLLGGLWGDLRMWDDLLPYLAGFRTIAFDAPGIGQTQLPWRPYGIGGLASFAAHVLDSAGVDRACVLGISHGGFVAQQLARSFPERVDRLVLVSTSPGVLGVPGRPDVLLRIAQPTVCASQGGRERNAGLLFGGRVRDNPELVRRWHLRPPASVRAHTFRLASTTGWTSLPWLRSLRAPTLVVHGDDDPIVPVVNARVLARLIPDARLHVAPGGGHLVLLDSADETLPVVTDFLTAIR